MAQPAAALGQAASQDSVDRSLGSSWAGTDLGSGWAGIDLGSGDTEADSDRRCLVADRQTDWKSIARTDCLQVESPALLGPSDVVLEDSHEVLADLEELVGLQEVLVVLVECVVPVVHNVAAFLPDTALVDTQDTQDKPDSHRP